MFIHYNCNIKCFINCCQGDNWLTFFLSLVDHLEPNVE